MNKRFFLSFSIALVFSFVTASFVYASVMPIDNESVSVNDNIKVKVSKTLIESSSVSDSITAKVFTSLNESSSVSDELKVSVIKP